MGGGGGGGNEKLVQQVPKTYILNNNCAEVSSGRKGVQQSQLPT